MYAGPRIGGLSQNLHPLTPKAPGLPPESRRPRRSGGSHNPCRRSRRETPAKLILQAIGSLHACLERKPGEVGAVLRHPGYRYSMLSHQNNHGVSYQTARSDLQPRQAEDC